MNNPSSFYDRKRTWTVLKVKEYLDFEVKVVEKGKKKVKRGEKRWLICETELNKRFKVYSGVTDRAFESPIGVKVTIKCQKMEGGIPVRPSFMRVYKGI